MKTLCTIVLFSTFYLWYRYLMDCSKKGYFIDVEDYNPFLIILGLFLSISSLIIIIMLIAIFLP